MLAAQGLGPVLHDEARAEYPRAMRHYARLCEHESFVPEVLSYLHKLEQDIEKDKERQRNEPSGQSVRSA